MNRRVSPKLVALTFGVLILLFLISFYALSWTEPSQAPPGGNVPAPLNVGSASQYKSGTLGIGGLFRAYSNLIVDGSVGIGLTSPAETLDVGGTIRIRGWDGVLHSYDTSGRYYDLIGNYQGWDVEGVYIAGYNAFNAGRATKKVYIGGPGTSVALCLSGDCRTGWPSISESDTLATVTSRGNTANTDILFDVPGDAYIWFRDGSGVQVYNPEGTGNEVRLGAAWNKPGVYSSGDLHLGSEGSIYINDNNQMNWRFDGGTVWRQGQVFYDGSTVYANRNNTTGGGLWISDDAGLYDYNNGFIDFRGSTGLRILEWDGSWGDNSIRATYLCMKDDCRSSWPSLSESDTLQSVTNRGNSTNQGIDVNWIHVQRNDTWIPYTGNNENYLRGVINVNNEIWKEGDWGVWLGGRNNTTQKVRVGEIYGNAGIYAPNSNIELSAGGRNVYIRGGDNGGANLDVAGDIKAESNSWGSSIEIASGFEDERWVECPNGYYLTGVRFDYCNVGPHICYRWYRCRKL